MWRDYLQAIPQYLFPHHALNRFAGFMANIRIVFIKNYLIRYFLNKYPVNMGEAVITDPYQYPSFNDFFIRHLQADARTIAEATVVSPVDGCVSEIGYLVEGQLLQAKGHSYSVDALLGGNPALSRPFIKGSFATLYLAPKDYHRVHMPIQGTLQDMLYIPGTLFSVQPRTARVVPHLFARNERLVAIFNTPVGLMAMVLVGAAIVGHLATVWQEEIGPKLQHINYSKHPLMLDKAMEMGYFKLGSTVIVLFAEPDKIRWLDDLKPGISLQLGQALVVDYES